MLADGSEHIAGVSWKVGRFFVTAWIGASSSEAGLSHHAASSSATTTSSASLIKTPTVSKKSITSKFISLKAPASLPPKKTTSSGFRRKKTQSRTSLDGSLASRLTKQPGIRAHLLQALNGPMAEGSKEKEALWLVKIWFWWIWWILAPILVYKYVCLPNIIQFCTQSPYELMRTSFGRTYASWNKQYLVFLCFLWEVKQGSRSQRSKLDRLKPTGLV